MAMRQEKQVVELTQGWWERGRAGAKVCGLEILSPQPTPFEDRQYYSVRQIAETLSVSIHTVYEWTYSRGLRRQRLPGRGVRVLGQVLNEFLREHAQRRSA